MVKPDGRNGSVRSSASGSSISGTNRHSTGSEGSVHSTRSSRPSSGDSLLSCSDRSSVCSDKLTMDNRSDSQSSVIAVQGGRNNNDECNKTNGNSLDNSSHCLQGGGQLLDRSGQLLDRRYSIEERRTLCTRDDSGSDNNRNTSTEDQEGNLLRKYMHGFDWIYCQHVPCPSKNWFPYLVRVHLHPLQAANCCRNSRLVVDDDELK